MPGPLDELSAQVALPRDNQLGDLSSLPTYCRLEPMALTDGTLQPGLQAPIGDPLWLLGRQWQFAELRGEDAGSPVSATIRGEHAPVTRFHPGPANPANPAEAAAEAVWLPDPSALPVEVAVEAEDPPVLPERVRAHTGLAALRLGLPATVRRALVTQYAFPPADDDPEDPVGTERRRLLAGRVPDGQRLTAALRPHLAGNALTSLPTPLAAAARDDVEAATARHLLGGWLAWSRRYLAGPPPGGRSSWQPHHLEYAFALQASLSSGDVVLRADEYATGEVEWYSFDATASPSLRPAQGPPPPPAVAIAETLIPTPVRYPGMPSDRLWAFEDAQVFLGGLEAGPVDLARLALVEFALAYGTDWFLLPLDLPYGSVARVYRLDVRDTFGIQTVVTPSRDAVASGWTLFQNTPVHDKSALADVFFLPATLRHVQEGPPLEEVALFRDELANMVWGVERIVQAASGEPVVRDRVPSTWSPYSRLDGDVEDVELVYRLMTSVPVNWIPFVAVPVEGGTDLRRFTAELERRTMIRHVGDQTEPVLPRGTFLGGASLRVADEEVPRDGAVLTRSFQLARTEGGGTVLWIGRRKRSGRGEGASGLRFDVSSRPGG
jgi:hypothetical protein